MISDIEIKSRQPTRALTGAKISAKMHEVLTRPRCIHAGIPGHIPSSAPGWAERDYRKRWMRCEVGGDILLEVPTSLNEGDLSVDFVADLRGLYTSSSYLGRNMEGAAPEDNIVVRGGVVVTAMIFQYPAELIGQSADVARALSYHTPDWLMSSFQAAASHELYGILEHPRGAWVYREGLTESGIDDALPVRVSVEVDPNVVDYGRPVVLSLLVRPYTIDDSGLTELPRFAEDKGDDLPQDQNPGREGRPDASAFSVWLLGFSAWARS